MGRTNSKAETKKSKPKSAWRPPLDVEVPDIRKGCNAGRWTLEEHLLFLHGLKTYGNTKSGAYKKIALFCPTRSKVQVRTHAQKVFQKKRQGIDVFEPLRENRKLTHYLISELIARAEDILKMESKKK